MVFPETVLPVHVEINPTGSAWVDVTSDVRGNNSGITISRGISAEGSQSSPSSCSLTLDNSSGNYTPVNPMGAYYPNLKRNCPLRVWLEGTDVTLRLTDDDDKVSTPDAAALDITGDLDIRFDVALDVWQFDGLNNVKCEVVGKWTRLSDERSWLVTLDDGYLKLLTSPDGTFTNAIEHITTEPLTYRYGERVAVKITVDVNNGSGGHTVTFYTSDSLSGSWTQLGDAVVTSGTTSIYSGSSELRIGRDTGGSWNAGLGKWYGFELRSGIDGSVVANPDFTAQTAGAASFVDAAGLTWTLAGSAEFASRNDRFIGEIADFVPSADITGVDRTVTIRASGVLRRLQQGESPLLSPIRRAITRLDPAPQAYWPLEDEEGSANLAAASADTKPMTYLGTPTLASHSGFEPNKPILAVNNARLTGIVPSYTDTDEIQVRFLVYFPSSGMANGDVVCSVYTGGALARIDLQWLTGGSLRLLGYDADSTLTHTGTTFGFGAITKNWRFSIELTQNGSDVDYGVWAIDPGIVGAGGGSGTFATATIGRCTRVVVNPNRECAATMAIGHVTVETAVSGELDQLYYELDAWEGERASTRIARLCKEEGVSSVFKRDYETSQMGPQSVSSLVSLLRECETADGGILFEPRHVFGLAYIGRRAMYGLPASVELDCAANELSRQLAPVFDDSSIRNDVTVSRTDGSSARATDSASVAANGRYDEDVTLNLHSDDVLQDHAAWRVHLGTVEGARFPRITVNRARTQIASDASLDQALLDLDVGNRVDVLNPGTWANYGDVRLLVVGLTEYLTNFEHTLTFNCQPFEPWNVGIYDDPDSRYDTSGSELGADIDADDVTFSGVTTSGPRWTTDDAEFPFDIVMDGEVMTVTDIANTTSPQTFTVTRSVNGVVKAHSAGASFGLARPVYYGL